MALSKIAKVAESQIDERDKFDTWLKWVHSAQFLACCLLGFCLILAHRGLVAPWGLISTDHGVLRGTGEFTLWQINITLEPEANLTAGREPFVVIDVSKGLCASSQSSQISRMCGLFEAMRVFSMLALFTTSVAFLLGGSVLFWIERASFVRISTLVAAVLSAMTSMFALAALVVAIALTHGKVAAHPRAGAVCTGMMVVAAFLAMLSELASFFASRRADLATQRSQKPVAQIV